MIATYTSVWGDYSITTAYQYDPHGRVVSEIEASDTEVGDDCLTDEYVTLPDGTELREEDGVAFDY